MTKCKNTFRQHFLCTARCFPIYGQVCDLRASVCSSGYKSCSILILTLSTYIWLSVCIKKNLNDAIRVFKLKCYQVTKQITVMYSVTSISYFLYFCEGMPQPLCFTLIFISSIISLITPLRCPTDHLLEFAYLTADQIFCGWMSGMKSSLQGPRHQLLLLLPLMD